MAKKSEEGKVSKSQEIRDLLAEDPKMDAKTVVDRLAEKGVKVSKNMVYLIKSQMRNRRRKAKREKMLNSVRQAGPKNPVEIIQKVKRLADEVGGIGQLKKLVDVLAE